MVCFLHSPRAVASSAALPKSSDLDLSSILAPLHICPLFTHFLCATIASPEELHFLRWRGFVQSRITSLVRVVDRLAPNTKARSTLLPRDLLRVERSNGGTYSPVFWASYGWPQRYLTCIYGTARPGSLLLGQAQAQQVGTPKGEEGAAFKLAIPLTPHEKQTSAFITLDN